MNIPIVFEDNYLVVLDKPSGLLVIPTPKKEKRTLSSILNDEHYKGTHFYPCHRIDRDTSGLIVYAKGKSVQQQVMDEFKQRRVRKKYTAFVSGYVLRGKGEVISPIEGKGAVTFYKVLERKKNFSVLEATPITGRTNQLRIHFKFMGHPILGDFKFAFRRDFKVKSKRLCLHATELQFTHPVSKKPLHFTSDLPVDMERMLHVDTSKWAQNKFSRSSRN
jgi:RluA family pseudouridine synthase